MVCVYGLQRNTMHKKPRQFHLLISLIVVLFFGLKAVGQQNDTLPLRDTSRSGYESYQGLGGPSSIGATIVLDDRIIEPYIISE